MLSKKVCGQQEKIFDLECPQFATSSIPLLLLVDFLLVGYKDPSRNTNDFSTL